MTLSAFSFGQSFALVGLIAIAVPVIIHLLSKSKGRLVQWGSLQLLPKAKSVKMTEIRLTQRLLLALRVFMVTVSVLILAQLYYDKNNSSDNIVLVSSAWLKAADEGDLAQLNDLLEKPSHSSYLLDDLSELKSIDQEFSADVIANYKNIWQLLLAASDKFTKAKQFHLFTINNTAQFVGEKPIINIPIHWNIKTLNQAIDEAKLVNTPLSVMLVVNAQDVNTHRYLLAALNTLQQVKYVNLSIKLVEHLSTIAEHQRPDWLFCLADSNVPNANVETMVRAWLTQGTKVLFDANTQTEHFQPQPLRVAGKILYHPFDLFKLTQKSTQETNSITLWQTLDGGNSLLTQTNVGRGSVYRFYSKFLPSWTNLVTQGQFPLVLQSLLLNEQIDVLTRESSQLPRQMIENLYLSMVDKNEQQNLSLGLTNSFQSSPTTVNNELLNWLGLCLILLVILERLISERLVRTSHIADQVSAKGRIAND